MDPVKQALLEDGAFHDLTSAIIPNDPVTGRFLAKQDLIVCGTAQARRAFQLVGVEFTAKVRDGDRVRKGKILATVRGPVRRVLAGERTALNFLQQLSGVATITRKFADLARPVRVFDTRKTTPGLRALEKHAVVCGGGHNHRMGLHDGILIKDNHLVALTGHADPIAEAVRLAREKHGMSIPVEIEVDTLDQLDMAVKASPDIVLLDNMPLVDLREAVRRRNAAAPSVRLEASGGVTLETIRAIAETGVDRISVGALTHSAPALDIGLDYLP